MRIRCQENGEGAALSLAPLLEGPLLGGHRLQLDLSYPHPGLPCVSVARPDRRGKACVRPSSPPLPAPSPHAEGTPPRPDPPHPASLPVRCPAAQGGREQTQGMGIVCLSLGGLLSSPPLSPEAPTSRLLVWLRVGCGHRAGSACLLPPGDPSGPGRLVGDGCRSPAGALLPALVARFGS